MSEASFKAWGWRIPFLVSLVLLAVSVYIRLKLDESPVFLQMKAQGKGSKAPLRESFGNWANLKIVLIALFGATAGQGVVWYTGQFYALFFLTGTLKVDWKTAYLIMAVALALGTGPLRLLRLALRPHRTKEDHAGRLPAGGGRPISPSTGRWPTSRNPALEAFSARTPITLVGQRLPRASVPQPQVGNTASATGFRTSSPSAACPTTRPKGRRAPSPSRTSTTPSSRAGTSPSSPPR